MVCYGPLRLRSDSLLLGESVMPETAYYLCDAGHIDRSHIRLLDFTWIVDTVFHDS
jgi:hypothetical protein